MVTSLLFEIIEFSQGSQDRWWCGCLERAAAQWAGKFMTMAGLGVGDLHRSGFETL